MTNAAAFLEHGLISLKDLTGTLIDVEQFRKQEQGTSIAPGDWLADWLSAKPEDVTLKADVLTPTAKRATERKGLSVKQKAKMKRNLDASVKAQRATPIPADDDEAEA